MNVAGEVAENPRALHPAFEGVVGHEAVLWALGRALRRGVVSHAYLFHGPAGVGKRTVARRFGAALVSGEDVRAQERARRGLHPDLTEVEPEGAFTTIGQVREVVRLASSRPFEGVRRVILLQADTLNVQAANALLKTLEEPEGETVFILLAGSVGGVLPTISSRAQPVRFDPVSRARVADFLRERGVRDPELAASLGRGSVGLSLRYAEDSGFGELREAVFRAAFSLEDDFEKRYETVAGILARAEAVGEAREREALEGFEEPDRRAKDRAKRAGRAARDLAVGEAVELLALLYRDAAVTGAGAPDLILNMDRRKEVETFAAENPDADFAGAALALEEARAGLAYNVSPEATLEVSLSKARKAIVGPYRGW